jgi:uncharacterized ferredoxin-like protein
MINGDRDISGEALKNISEFLCLAARTAPKTRGRDHLVISIPDKEEKAAIIKKMKQIASRDSRKGCERDAESIKDIDRMVLIGVRNRPLELNCGFCGFSTCKELSEKGGVCAFNSMDLGIALGSAVSMAARFHVDNRLMFSMGKAAVELNMLGNDIVQAIGIPLSATGKNIFFDR